MTFNSEQELIMDQDFALILREVARNRLRTISKFIDARKKLI
jgi:hypothetical protein